MTSSPRLLTCLGAGLIALAAAAPAAHASTAPQQAPAVPSCGATSADFAGGYVDIEYPEVGYNVDTDKATITVYYRGQAIDQGSVSAGNGSVMWKVDGTIYVSENVTCGDATKPSRVTAIETIAPANQEHMTLGRA